LVEVCASGYEHDIYWDVGVVRFSFFVATHAGKSALISIYMYSDYPQMGWLDAGFVLSKLGWCASWVLLLPFFFISLFSGTFSLGFSRYGLFEFLMLLYFISLLSCFKPGFSTFLTLLYYKGGMELYPFVSLSDI